jgi:hypothetical protein
VVRERQREWGFSRARYGEQVFGKRDWDATEKEEQKGRRRRGIEQRGRGGRRWGGSLQWRRRRRVLLLLLLGRLACCLRGPPQLVRRDGTDDMGRFGGVRASYKAGAEDVDSDFDDPNVRRNTITLEGNQFEAIDSQDETTDAEPESEPPKQPRVVRSSSTLEPEPQPSSGPIQLDR